MSTAPMIVKERLAHLPALRLDRGPHEDFSEGHCAMEVVAWLAGEGHTDAPQCASRVLRIFTVGLNDAWTDEDRQRLAPYLPRMVGTAGDGQDEARSYLALDWLIRTYTPAFLDLAGLTVRAQELRDLRRIVDPVSAKQAGPVVGNARNEAWDAGDAAWDAGDAAWDAGDAAWDAGDAAWDAAGAAAGAAAWGAARAAARAAVSARKKLAPTIELLQASALDLLEQMINPQAQA